MTYLYFIRSGKRVKIGITVDLKRRLKEINIHLPVPAYLIGYVEGTYHAEKFIHGLLDDHRLSGEWFKYNDAVALLIDQLLAHGLESFGFKEPPAKPAFVPTPVSEANRLAALNLALDQMWLDPAKELVAFTGYPESEVCAWMQGKPMPRLVEYSLRYLMLEWFMFQRVQSFTEDP
jgi:hypothetical protein